MDNMVFAAWVSGRLDFTDADRRACFATVNTFVGIATDVRRNGLLWLDDRISTYDDFLLRQGLQLAIDSTEPEMVRQLLHNWIIFGNYRGAELLKSLIIVEGVISVVQGWSPKSIRMRLGAFFGKDLYEEYVKKTDIGETPAQST